jgi:uncharacterized surface protein with fasciclin (FAS1) repeats
MSILSENLPQYWRCFHWGTKYFCQGQGKDILSFILIIPLRYEDILPMNDLKIRKIVVATLGVALAATTIGAVQAQSKPVDSKSPVQELKKTPATSGAATTVPGNTKPTGKPTVAQDKPAVPAANSKVGTIVEVAASNSPFSILVSAIKSAELVEVLSAEGPYTVFAPTDAAFNKIPKATLAKLADPKNKAELQRVLKYHVVAGAITAAQVKSGQVKTAAGSTIRVVAAKGAVTINGAAKVIKTDIKASNGYIHAIDTVLLPPNLKLI